MPWLVASLPLLSTVLAVSAGGAQYTIDAGRLRADPSGAAKDADTAEAVEPSFIELPCVPAELAAHEQRLFVACDEGGVAVLSIASPLAPRLLAVRDVGGRVAGFHVAAGRLWAEVTRLEARPLTGQGTAVADTVAPGPAAASMPMAEGPPKPQTPLDVGPAPVGEVVEARGDGVVISLGSGELAPGDHVSLYVVHDVVLAAGEEATHEDEVVAVGAVASVSKGHARVTLGLNERVSMPAKARKSNARLTASRFVPPRAAEVWSAAFTVRPFLTLGSFGVGTVSDARVSYRLPESFQIQAVFEPLGIGVADEGNVIATAGNVIASYDTHVFEIGLGAGWSAVNNELDSTSRSAAALDTSGVGGITNRFDNVQYGVSIAQIARLGAEDGIHLLARNTFILYDDEFHYGGTVGEVMVPVGARSWLLGRGGGGASGFGYGEIGLRLLLTGNGLTDSFFATASLGGAGLFGEAQVAKKKCQEYGDYHQDAEGRCYESVGYAGPMVGLGVEWRP